MKSNPSSFVVYDTEFWTDEGVMERLWSGLDDHPPLLTQVAAFKIERSESLEILDEMTRFVIPRGKSGDRVELTDFFLALTKISQEQFESEAIELTDCIAEFQQFVGEDLMYSYGRDDLATLVPSCYLSKIPYPLSPLQARDVRQVLRKSALSDDEIRANTSGTIAQHLGVDMSESHYAHDARNDAYSILCALRELLARGELSLEDL